MSVWFFAQYVMHRRFLHMAQKMKTVCFFVWNVLHQGVRHARAKVTSLHSQPAFLRRQTTHGGQKTSIRWTWFLLVFVLPSVLWGCGPKVVGEEVAPHRPSGALSAAHDPAELRYPASGRNIDKALYLLNDPERMYMYQENFRAYLRSDYGETPEEYRNLQPRQVSPFRQ